MFWYDVSHLSTTPICLLELNTSLILPIHLVIKYVITTLKQDMKKHTPRLSLCSLEKHKLKIIHCIRQLSYM